VKLGIFHVNTSNPLKGEVTKKEETAYMTNTIQQLLEVVSGALKKPFSPHTSRADQIEWACQLLGLNPGQVNTPKEVRAAFIKLSKKEHPDKGGFDDYYQRLVQARYIMLKHLKT
jgi:hypothetical protein